MPRHRPPDEVVAMVPLLRRLIRSPSTPEFEADTVAPLGWKGASFCAGVFLFGLLVIGSMQFQKTDLMDGDAYYHTRVARLYQENGILDKFPWTQASIWKDHYVDKEFLFHVLLIPFLGKDMIVGPKVLTVVLPSLLLALLAYMLLRFRIPAPWLWIALVLAAGVAFFYRMDMTRPHLLAVPLAVLGAYCMLRRNVVGLLLVSLFFPLCYTAFHLLLALVLLYCLACILKREPFPWRLLAAVVLGTVVGLLLHPHHAHILHFWYVQNVVVVLNAWRILKEMGTEFRSPGGRLMLWDSGMVLLCLWAGCLFFMLRGRRASLRTVFLFLAASGFMIMFFNIIRFVEYWVPFTILFAASSAKDLLAEFDLGSWLASHRRAGSVATVLFMLLLLVGMMHSVMLSQRAVDLDEFPFDKEESLWINDHVPPGQTVFTCNWDVTPSLFFYAPRVYTLVALDPTFMLAYDPQLFDLWQSIATGKEPDAARLIVERFQSHWVLGEHRIWNEDFVSQASRDRRFFITYNGAEAVVFALPADPVPAALPALAGAAAASIPGGYLETLADPLLNPPSRPTVPEAKES